MPSAANNMADFYLFSKARDKRAIIGDTATWNYGQVADLTSSYMSMLTEA
jgi:hypothetical protein